MTSTGPHRSLPALLTEHPHWAVTYDPSSGIYTARRPLRPHHRSFGITRDTVASRDTAELADLIRVCEAVRAGADYTNPPEDMSDLGRALAAQAERYANNGQEHTVDHTAHLILEGSFTDVRRDEGHPTRQPSSRVDVQAHGTAHVTYAPGDSWYRSAVLTTAPGDDAIDVVLRSNDGTSLGVRFTPTEAGGVQFDILTDDTPA